MSSVKRLIGLLSHLKASGGEVETRIRLQKEEFLLGLICPNIFESREFEYHHYGPYNRGLSETLQFAVSMDLVEEIDNSPHDKAYTKFLYRITDAGSDSIEGISECDDEKLDHWAKALKSYHWRVLELVSTIRFLEMNEALDQSSAFKEALELKPATTAYAKEAQKLLEELSNN